MNFFFFFYNFGPVLSVHAFSKPKYSEIFFHLILEMEVFCFL